jgi:hypothetical protein
MRLQFVTASNAKQIFFKTDMKQILIQSRIYHVRGKKVMLDYDLAKIYGVKTKVLNQAIKRNQKKFPRDFMFQLNVREWNKIAGLATVIRNVAENKTNRSQFVTGSKYRSKHFFLMFLLNTE